MAPPVTTIMTPAPPLSPDRHDQIAEDKMHAWKQMHTLAQQLGLLQIRSETADLRELLTMWRDKEHNGKQADFMAQRLSRKYTRKKTLLVVDMSGFSRVVKEEGIIHFLSLVNIMQALCLPILESAGGELVKVAADNLFVLFDVPVGAVHSALDCMAVTKSFNQGRAKNDQIWLSIGIAQGMVWIVPGVDVFGSTADVAFRVGEDLSEKEVLVTSPVADALRIQQHKVAEMYQMTPKQMDVNGEMMTLYSISSNIDRLFTNSVEGDVDPLIPIIHPQVASEEPTIFTMMSAKRNRIYTAKGREAAIDIDNQIKGMYMRECAVLVIEMHDQPRLLGQMGELGFMDMVFNFKTSMEVIVEGNYGKPVEAVHTKVIGQMFALFSDVPSALNSAFEAMKVVTADYNCEVACGLGWGECLDLGGFNAFGDPVNMAFKLGEDTAEGGEILMDAKCKDFWQEDNRTSFEARSVTMSGITIPYYSVTRLHSQKASDAMQMKDARDGLQNKRQSSSSGMPSFMGSEQQKGASMAPVMAPAMMVPADSDVMSRLRELELANERYKATIEVLQEQNKREEERHNKLITTIAEALKK